MNKLLPLFAPDATAGGGTVIEGNEPSPQTLIQQGNASRSAPPDSVYIPRAEYDRIQQASREAEALKSQVKDLSELKSTVGALYGETPINDPALAQQHARKLFTQLGWRPDKIDAEMQRIFPVEESQVQPTKRQPQQAPQPDPQMRQHMDVMKQVVQSQFADSINSALGSNDTISKIKSNITGRGPEGKKDAVEFHSIAENEVRAILTDLLRKREAEQGTFKIEWFKELAPVAVQQFERKARLIGGDPNRIGRSQDSDAGEDSLEAALKRDPVAAPSWKPGMTEGDIDKAASEFIADGLVRAVAQTRANGGASAF